MLDPFQTLGLPRRFDVDLRVAEKNHRELSRALHPDKYAGGTPTERRDALTKAADVNEAWRIIRDPVRRAEALFGLAGVEVGETKEPKPAPELLMEVLEKREALADAKAERNPAKVRALADEMAAREQTIEAALAEAKVFDPALVTKLGELRFYRRFMDEASSILEQLTEGAS
jgi:molecular chaperone HscB